MAAYRVHAHTPPGADGKAGRDDRWEQGGIDGTKINLDTVDYSYKVPEAIAQYKRWTTQGMVFLHGWGTGDTEALSVKSAFEVTMLECAAHFLLTEHLQGQIYDPPIGPPGYAR